MTQSESRKLEIWTASEAPILGVVLARATVHSERTFARPIPGVPQRGPLISHYLLELLDLSRHERSIEDAPERCNQRLGHRERVSSWGFNHTLPPG